MNEATVSSVGSRFGSLRDTSLDEWVVRDRPGLEHGFRLVRPTPGTTSVRAKLQFDLAWRGHSRPGISPGGTSLCLRDDASGTKITYAEMSVCDGQSRKLPARFIAAAQGIRLEVETTGACYPITIDPLAQQAYLQAGNSETKDLPGHPVAISGATVMVWAAGEAGGPAEGRSDPAAGAATGSGTVYVFGRHRGTWSQRARFEVPASEAAEVFAFSLACSRDTLVLTTQGHPDGLLD